jgi:hypothetical protein
MAMEAFGVPLLIKLPGGYKWFAGSFAENGLVKATINGEIYEWEDPLGRMGRLHNKPFGMAHAAKNVIGSPSLAKVGEKIHEKESEGVLERADILDGDFDAQRSYYGVTEIDEKTLVNLDDWVWMVPGSADPRVGQRVEGYIEKMFAHLDKRSVVDMMMVLTFFGVGIGTPFLLSKLETTGTGDQLPSVPVPMLADLVGVIV